MIAPKSPGHLVRSTFLQNKGVPTLIAIHNNHSGNAKEIAELVFYLKKYQLKKKIKFSNFLEIGYAAGINNSILNKFDLFEKIPFNPFPGVKFKPTDQNKINDFRNILLESGIMTTTRKTRGDDIQAACGQLSGQVMNLAKKTLRQKLKKTLH